jgi:hypothetical protein
MSGGPLEAICGAVLFIGIFASLFCLILAVIAQREREAAGLFVLALLFCCLLVMVISLLVFI